MCGREVWTVWGRPALEFQIDLWTPAFTLLLLSPTLGRQRLASLLYEKVETVTV